MPIITNLWIFKWRYDRLNFHNFERFYDNERHVRQKIFLLNIHFSKGTVKVIKTVAIDEIFPICICIFSSCTTYFQQLNNLIQIYGYGKLTQEIVSITLNIAISFYTTIEWVNWYANNNLIPDCHCARDSIYPCLVNFFSILSPMLYRGWKILHGLNSGDNIN